MAKLTETLAYAKLKEHKKSLDNVRISKLFELDPKRIDDFTFEFNDFLFDFSKNLINRQTLNLLIELAEEQKLPEKIEQMFNGEKLNFTEHRAVLHIALRNIENRTIKVDGWDVMPKVNSVLLKMRNFTEMIHNGFWRGFRGDRITDIVHIGIGGSDLGPRLVCDALEPYRKPNINVHFVSNVDGRDIQKVLNNLNPFRTLFIIASKSFTTQETLINANTAKEWFLRNTNASEKDISKHFVAISTHEEACRKFGIPPENMFHFWNWVGGRFSLWSAIGLIIALYIGFENFESLLEGAFLVDKHFRNTPLHQNIPVLMGLLSVWYNNFWNFNSQAIIPYDLNLRLLPDYLQQLIMESNGKRIDKEGNVVNYPTSPIIWGKVGTDCQHSFFQLLHQGTQIVPIDFLAPVEPFHSLDNHHNVLISNLIAQSEALMQGKSKEEAEIELESSNLDPLDKIELLPHKVFPGNRPSTTIFYRRLSPKTLGSLLAFYEHRVFVEGIIWNINSFDQWGVELGKQLAKKVLQYIESKKIDDTVNPSTRKLIEYYLKNRKM
ncbi:glucose-6-phosphate isomerase [Bacteroidetes/Chlorobi group bacterium Naka2016]|jgi:glucose-6-phosphate isomerase|nr:MAG: glucose-6-phosphate isomerase [Bacteroidetes/Chlorobi group bacterium Naka2016]